MRSIFLLVAFMCSSQMLRGEPPTPTATPSVKVPAGMEGLVWHKWDTDNFIVISLDKSFGKSIKSDIESIRSDFLGRWGISSDRQYPCKLVCVPDPEMLKKLFGLSVPRCEVHKSDSGEVTEAAIWIDEERLSLLSSLIAKVELSTGKFRRFVSEGVPVLERSAATVREEILSAKEQPAALLLGESESKEDVHTNSAIVCLLIRKEFGADAFGKISRKTSDDVYSVLGFSSEKDLSDTFIRYKTNLVEDVKDNKTPDKYLKAAP